MKSTKKRLQIAIEKTQKLPDSWFGNRRASIEELPSVQNKWNKVRKNLFLEIKTVKFLEKKSKEYSVTFTSLANDILTEFVKGQIGKNKNISKNRR